jgi:2-oxoisovalerate dehydrogenase E1 component
MRRAVENCRRNRGPSFVHAKVIRPYSHSLSDDEKLYRADEERASDAERDPVKRFGARLIDERIIDQDGLQQLKDEIDREINEAADAALASPQPSPETVTDYVYSPNVDPTSSDFDTEESVDLSGNPGTMVDLDQSLLAHRDEARSTHRCVWRGRCGLLTRTVSGQTER